MNNKKGFWIAQMLGLLAVYAVAAVFVMQGHTERRLILVVEIILGLHLLEIPLAFYMLKGRNAQPLRVIVLTQIFGLLWWVPAKRGVFAVN